MENMEKYDHGPDTKTLTNRNSGENPYNKQRLEVVEISRF